MYIFKHIYIYLYVSVCISIYVYTCLSIYIYIYIYILMYKHTNVTELSNYLYVAPHTESLQQTKAAPLMKDDILTINIINLQARQPMPGTY